MRRSEKEITDRAEIDAIIRRCRVCRLGLSDQGQPYVVPLCFGYDGQALYFHCAKEGRKLDILRRNNRVCFEFDVLEGMVEADQGCQWSIRYESVIGFGTASLVEEPTQRQEALALLMAQYSDRAFAFPEIAVNRTVIVRIDIENVTGKQSKR
jgi:uncharacterized protein